MAFRIHNRCRVFLNTFLDRASDVRVRYVNKKKTVTFLKDKVESPMSGLYVFVISQKGGVGIPWYVGKTEIKAQGSLVKEAFENDKLRKYARALAEEGSGAADLFFLVPQDLKRDKIQELETFLIWLALQRNPRLINEIKVQLTPMQLQRHFLRHEITGVMNSGRGKPKEEAKRFKKMIGWQKKMFVVAREF